MQQGQKIVLVGVIAYYQKQEYKFKFPKDTKIIHIEEFLRRKINAKATQSIFLFSKNNKKILNSSESIGNVAWPVDDRENLTVQIVIRKTQVY